MDVSSLEKDLARLERVLRPIADRPVDLAEPAWVEKLLSSRPVDEAGIRSEAQRVLENLVVFYSQGHDEQRAAVRTLLDTYPAFRWAASLRCRADTAEGFRMHLLHFSACDQGSDARDEILKLRHLCQVAAKSGVDIVPILKEVAALSSDADRYHMGSTRSFLLNAC